MASDLEALAVAFEDTSHPDLSHEEHVQLAFHYLSKAPLHEVVPDFRQKLMRYAESKCAPGTYHETVTWAFLIVINERMQLNPGAGWEAFAEANADLLSSQALAPYYTKEELDSEVARNTFVLPRSGAAGDSAG